MSSLSCNTSCVAKVFFSIDVIKSDDTLDKAFLLVLDLSNTTGAIAFFIVSAISLAPSPDIFPVSMSLTFVPSKSLSAIFLPSILSITVYSVVYLLSFLDALLAYQHKLLFPKASCFLIRLNYNDVLALTKNSSYSNFQANLEKELAEKMFISIYQYFIFSTTLIAIVAYRMR